MKSTVPSRLSMMQTTVSIHHGSYESIPADASPGLIFLQRFMPVVDAINPGQCSITSFFTPSAPILINSNPPSSASQAVPLLHVRSRHLAHFHHKVHIAWDIDLSSETGPVPSSQPVSADAITDVNTVASEETTLYAPLTSKVRMKRTVMFEATSETVFKNDPDHFPVKTREFNILDLEGANQDDLQVVEMRVFLDSKPVQARAASLSMASAYADG